MWTALALGSFMLLWYWRTPDAKAIPLVLLAGGVGYLLGRATNRELLGMKDKELARLDRMHDEDH